MRIGISTASLYPLETEKALEILARQGIKTTEIFFNALSELEPQFVKKLRTIKEAYSVDIAAIHPTMSLAESFMLFSNYDRRLREGLEWYKRYGEIAAELGAKYIVMHGGKPNGILSDEEYCERFLKISDAAARGGGILLQENVVNFRAGNVAFLEMMVKNLGKRAAFCLDVKQTFRGGYTPKAVIDAVGDNIKHIHISDHNNKYDCMLPGDGDFDFVEFFADLEQKGYEGAAMIEVYSNAYSSYADIFSSFDNISTKIP